MCVFIELLIYIYIYVSMCLVYYVCVFIMMVVNGLYVLCYVLSRLCVYLSCCLVMWVVSCVAIDTCSQLGSSGVY